MSVDIQYIGGGEFKYGDRLIYVSDIISVDDETATRLCRCGMFQRVKRSNKKTTKKREDK